MTGGAGFIGSHYVRTLLSGGYPGYEDAAVTVLDKLTYAGNLANLEPVTDSPRLRFVRGDIVDPELVPRWYPGMTRWSTSRPRRTWTGRFRRGAVRHHQRGRDPGAAAGVPGRRDRPVVQVSTDEVYGSVATGRGPSRRGWSRIAVAAAKAGGDLIAGAYARTHGLDVRITRCCNNYGPYQYPEKVIPLFVTNLLDGQPVPLYGDGGNVRGWIHVDDHCRGIQLVLERGQPGRRITSTAMSSWPTPRLTAALLECCGAGWDMVARVPDRKGHDRRYSLDNGVLRAMGYAPRASRSARAWRPRCAGTPTTAPGGGNR